jgi:hypothetical protein
MRHMAQARFALSIFKPPARKLPGHCFTSSRLPRLGFPLWLVRLKLYLGLPKPVDRSLFSSVVTFGPCSPTVGERPGIGGSAVSVSVSVLQTRASWAPNLLQEKGGPGN